MAVKVPVSGFLLWLPASSPSSALALDEEGLLLQQILCVLLTRILLPLLAPGLGLQV